MVTKSWTCRTPHTPHPPTASRLAWIAAGLVLAATLALGGCTRSNPKSPLLGDLLDSFMPPTPQQAAHDAFNMYDPDKRREGVTLLSAAPFGGKTVYVKMYRLMLNDPDPTVRAACAEALGIHGTAADAAKLAPLLEDTDAFVRWQAAKALQRLHNPVVVPQLIDRMQNDQDPDVRMACANALGQYAQPRVFDALVGALADSDYGVVAAAEQSLETLTGYTAAGDDGAKWIHWREAHHGNLFTNQIAYTYQPYDAPPGFLRKLEFWNPIESPKPQTPAGMKTNT